MGGEKDGHVQLLSDLLIAECPKFLKTILAKLASLYETQLGIIHGDILPNTQGKVNNEQTKK